MSEEEKSSWETHAYFVLKELERHHAANLMLNDKIIESSDKLTVKLSRAEKHLFGKLEEMNKELVSLKIKLVAIVVVISGGINVLPKIFEVLIKP